MMNFKQYLLENEENPFATLQGKLMGLNMSYHKCHIPVNRHDIEINNLNLTYKGFISVKKVLIEIVNSHLLGKYRSYDHGHPDSQNLTHLGAYIIKEIHGTPTIDFDESKIKDQKNPESLMKYATGLIYEETINKAIENATYMHNLIVKNPKLDLAEYDDNKLDDDSFYGIERMLWFVDQEIAENKDYVDAYFDAAMRLLS